jgi:hypothetical protein
MQDAVDLIGKNISYNNSNYIISKIWFVPSAVSPKHNIYFGLQGLNKTMLNVSYVDLLPFLTQQIKL